MLHWKIPLVAMACLAASTSSFAGDLIAVVHRDTPLVLDAADPGLRPKLLAQGDSVSIIPEMSNDLRLFVKAADGVTTGWIDRSAASWPDGSPIEGDPDQVTPAAEVSDANGLGPEESPRPVKGKKPRKGSRGNAKKAPAAAAAEKPAIAATKAEVSAPRPPLQERSLQEMLMGLVSEAPEECYARSVVHDGSLTRDEKVLALKLYYKYLQEQRTKLAGQGDAAAAARERLQRQSEELLQNLASLDLPSGSVRKGSPTSSRVEGAAKRKSAARVKAREPKALRQLVSRPHGDA
ncbi:MAG: hypothetical protein HY814_12665 [Candidatus Riflebacteria bacterium]|nr:hypothetical protein [Candidatus Riflebacteria bacterium]